MSTLNKYKDRKEIIARRGYRKDIVGDKFSLYISSYPVAIQYLATKIGNLDKSFVELCCGIGVTLEILAPYFLHGTGVDIDPEVIKNCRLNLEAATLTNKIDLIYGNVSDLKLLKSIKADIAIYDVPYWSPYNANEITTSTTENPEFKQIVQNIKDLITPDVIIFASPLFTFEYISSVLGECEYEQVYINGKYDRNIIYLGALNSRNGITQVKLKSNVDVS